MTKEYLYDFPVSETFAGYELEMMYGDVKASQMKPMYILSPPLLSIDNRGENYKLQARTTPVVDKKKPKTYKFDSIAGD